MKAYIPLIAVMVFSFGAAYFLPLEKVLLGIIATPGGLALFGALYQILRDQSAHERKIELQRRQEIFNLGATSNMANVAFDKHVEFCGKYMSEVHDTVSTLSGFKDALNKKTDRPIFLRVYKPAQSRSVFIAVPR